MFAVCAGGAVAVFVAADFKAAYPAFAAVPDALLQAFFSIATIYLRNDGSGPVRDTNLQTQLLWMLTAHVGQISGALNPGGVPSGLVGRITSASEGSVSVSSDYPSTPNNAWFVQTPYGAMYWQATAAFRMARYLPGPTRFGTGIGNSGRLNPWTTGGRR
jgi:hypothetical protein